MKNEENWQTMEKNNPFETNLTGEYVPGQKPLYRKLPNVDEMEKEMHKQPVMPGQRVVKSKWYAFLKFFFVATIVLCIIGGFMFLNLVKDGKFQSSVNQEVNVNPNWTSNDYNNYTFNPNTENNYNHTIVNEINFELSDEFIEAVCGNYSA